MAPKGWVLRRAVRRIPRHKVCSPLGSVLDLLDVSR
jgi:hypothetical protein